MIVLLVLVVVPTITINVSPYAAGRVLFRVDPTGAQTATPAASSHKSKRRVRTNNVIKITTKKDIWRVWTAVVAKYLEARVEALAVTTIFIPTLITAYILSCMVHTNNNTPPPPQM